MACLIEVPHAQLAFEVIMQPKLNLGLVEPVRRYRFDTPRLLNSSSFQQLVNVPERGHREGSFPGVRNIGEATVFLWLCGMQVCMYDSSADCNRQAQPSPSLLQLVTGTVCLLQVRCRYVVCLWPQLSFCSETQNRTQSISYPFLQLCCFRGSQRVFRAVSLEFGEGTSSLFEGNMSAVPCF